MRPIGHFALRRFTAHLGLRASRLDDRYGSPCTFICSLNKYLSADCIRNYVQSIGMQPWVRLCPSLMELRVNWERQTNKQDILVLSSRSCSIVRDRVRTLRSNQPRDRGPRRSSGGSDAQARVSWMNGHCRGRRVAEGPFHREATAWLRGWWNAWYGSDHLWVWREHGWDGEEAIES